MHRGSCRCGRIEVQLTRPPRWVANCHCADCRKATGAAFSTYVGCARDAAEVVGEVSAYASSEGVRRTFCGHCGSAVAYEGARWPDEIHFFVGLFDEPSRFVPTMNVYTCDELPWVGHLADMPRYLRTRAEDDGG